ncbi:MULTISPECIES: c-type cytochrome [Hydrogenophaga]|uniref:Cytochrome c n=1 Tax=Hydrogenophaga intermedia TaxID=65786 RepID=A0A1L1PKU1_HYDIT|nr:MULTISPECIES: cytochrome c [Hydrogenophaga]AOS81944.1 cytochrome C [Hydrogenophaga sp. PBC]TMU78412.1 cytochrome c [Hydrogenophaga intermedia]CDN89384.1 Cytochrome c [Hydrogenophaga intermedia]
MQKIAPLVLALAAVAVSAPATAQFQRPDDAIKYRKASFTVLATHFSRVGAMANGRMPFDAKVAAESAGIAEAMSKLPWEAFGPGTDKGDSRAEPEVWTEQAKFKAASEKMMTEVAKLNAAAKTGNLDQIKAAFGAAGASCKACHDDFRKN